ncbi:ArsA family ATPase [Sandaracinus amylolyticus]|uniref:arsenite-transporting ATPase n=1 Tax=Sandaracinus amylolyticus TaxID=927083 RepID=A0A0F6YHV6_9BACT|nr:ArsA-related P-loop ATPase [Sandaracinus amylolyticus]AKF06251.1 Arsenical pump-driving ATPase [Sandaracinus amylolyticus]
MIDPRARALQLVTGKGGVGKSTLVAALALAWAERGRRPLVVELGRRASIESVIAGAPRVGWDPVEVAPGVHATNVEGGRAVLEVLARWVRVRRLAQRALRSEVMQAFVDAAPGVVEMATMERILELLGDGWDPVLVDADASGHALMFLGLPQVFDELGAAGPVAALLARTRGLFADARRSALHLVTLPGALPVQETIELEARLREQGHVALGAVFVSRAPEAPRVSSERVEVLRTHADGALAPELAWLARDVALAAEARARIDALRARIGRDVIELPEIDETRPSIDALRALGHIALRGLA